MEGNGEIKLGVDALKAEQAKRGMTPKRAIEILESKLGFPDLFPGCDEWKARKLGIEALEREEFVRTFKKHHWLGLLPGETE